MALMQELDKIRVLLSEQIQQQKGANALLLKVHEQLKEGKP